MRGLVLAVATVFVLAACGGAATGEGEAPKGDSAQKKESPQGVVTVGDRTFSFVATRCMVSDEDTLISGPGQEEGGDVVWVDVDATSATEGELRIDIGVNEEFKSSDDIVVVQEDFALAESGGAVEITGKAYADTGIAPPASMTVDCG